MHSPTDRKPYRLAATPRETRALCGCGLSHTFPFCDGSQMIAETQRADRLVRCGAAKQAHPMDGQAQVA